MGHEDDSIAPENITVDITLLESGHQIQQAFIGLEPALFVRGEWDPNENRLIFRTTAVDLTPGDIVDLCNLLAGAASDPQLLAQYEAEKAAAEAEALEQEAADKALVEANAEFEAAQTD